MFVDLEGKKMGKKSDLNIGDQATKLNVHNTVEPQRPQTGHNREGKPGSSWGPQEMADIGSYHRHTQWALL